MIPHLSHSTFSDWKECGEKVRLRKIVRVPSFPSWSLVGGSLVHKVTETLDFQDFGITMDAPAAFDPDTWEAAILREEEKWDHPRELWRAAGRSSKEWPDKENSKWWLHHGPTQVANWRRFLQNSIVQIAITPDGEPAIEIDFEVEIGGVPVVGYIDRVMEFTDGSGSMVLDLKSGSRDPASAEQLGLYRLGLSKTFGDNFTPNLGTYFMTRKGCTTVPVNLQHFSDGRLEHDYKAVWTAIKADVFVPKVGPLCGYCGVRDYCRAVDGPLADTVLPYGEGK